MKTKSGQSDSLNRDFIVDDAQSQNNAQLEVQNSSQIDSQDANRASSPHCGSESIAVVEGVSDSGIRDVAINLPRPSEFNDSSVSTQSRIPFYLIGILLTATAIAKLWMLLTDPFADVRVGLPREILWLSVAFEFWLAFENFRLRDQRVMAFVNTVVFASFAILASIRLAMGYRSCGCSGSLELPAWIFIAFDIGIVAWFSGSSFRRKQITCGLNHLTLLYSSWAPEKRGRLTGLGIFAVLIVVLQLPFSAPLRAMILGEPAILAIVRMDDELKLDQESAGQVEIHNRSGQSAKIVGMSRSCRCFDLAQDPISKTVSANEKITLPLVVKPIKIGTLYQRVVLFLDHPKQFRLNVDVSGSVLGEDDE